MHTDAVMFTDHPYGAVVPYLRSYKPIVLDHYRHPKPEAYIDVFAPEFEKLCDKTAKKIAAASDLACQDRLCGCSRVQFIFNPKL